MAHTLSTADADLITCVLRHNLFLLNNNYIMCNVFDQATDRVEPVCLGEINAIQADTCDQNAMLDASSASDVQSSTNS
ncbi:LEF-10 [Epiphyas postvittana nucleopolyhedrovirus]|uniref:LEF-10 n=1 Tax=Epiphyas postvittana nucleopolyhedrovirus TaxID=70600 RepID=Q91GK3_NPVEP|nr:LEF-10 [Epiphyas postvittana nucleopolyhedrovirus]AAK85612.1 LEF-10 [Epiphyas postvittana nucleopolyhedrovirus]